MKIITKTIWVLSLVSMFTDVASEMLYPIMPLFLQHIGYTAVFIGVLEGVAEATAGLSKSYFGKLSDGMGRRMPFVQLGYALSALSKPMLAIFVFPVWIFFSRTIDRLGKGIRTGARDAILSDQSTPATKATVFGFHRSLDTLGAVLGPAIALLYLYFYPEDYRTLFLLAFLPGVAAIALTFLIKEKKLVLPTDAPAPKARFLAFFSYLKTASVSYKKLLTGLLLFALVNSSDVFLLLKMKTTGLDDRLIIGLYIFYNLVYAAVAYPIGKLADKLGLKNIFVTGLLLFTVVYTGFAFECPVWLYKILLALYGLYAASTEGVAKAWISNIVPKTSTATAIATYSGMQSLAALFASSVGGLIWVYAGPMATFLVAAAVSLLVAGYLVVAKIAEN